MHENVNKSQNLSWWKENSDLHIKMHEFVFAWKMAFSSRHSVVSTNEKSDMAAECFSRDGLDKRWTLPFSLLCLFGCVFCVCQPKDGVTGAEW